MATLLGLTSSLITCFQPYVAMLNVHGLYHTSKYDSGLLFCLDLVVAFVDLTITFEQTY